MSMPTPIVRPEPRFTKLFIDNEWVDAVSGKTFATFDPTTDKKKICDVAEADQADVDLAVAAAKRAFAQKSEWRTMDPSKRGELLNKLADLLEENQVELASLETYDNGMPFMHAFFASTAMSIKAYRYYAGWADKNHGKTIPVDGDFMSMTIHEPIGVCGQITPWNFPLAMQALKIGPALALGNTVVLKPAEQTPLSALFVAELVKRAGFPKGVLNVVPGFGPSAGGAITNHPDVEKIAFTGSTGVGKMIMAGAAKSNIKKISLELGGKSPCIILNDADMDEAVGKACDGVFFNSGQVCSAASRTFVQSGIYDEFVAKVRERAQKRVVGCPWDPKTEQGPIINERQYKMVLSYIEAGKKSGAKLECGGGPIDGEGFFVQPTVFSNVTDDMIIAREEIFGPVMQILKFETLDEVIERGNNTNYGLAAGVFTKNLSDAMYISKNLRAGTVWINCYNNLHVNAPFGGFKESGIGRENGEYALEVYSEVKTITMKIPPNC